MKRIVSAAILILLTLIAGLSVECFYTLVAYSYSRPAPIPEAPPPTVSEIKARSHPLTYYQPIVARDLFRTKDRATKPAVLSEPAENIEPTDLNIRLWGTVTGQGPDSYAVIESIAPNHRRSQQLYRQGDVVASATIKKILPDKVILDHNGTSQVLLLEDFKSASRLPMPRRFRYPALMRRTISRKTLENAVGNVNQLLGQARIVPAGRGGMRILAIKPRSLFRRMGLRNGDVITGVNNRQLHSMDDAMSLYQNLKNGEPVSIQLLRRGRRETIEYRVR
jgi:general secretion pathway protein C